MTNETVVSVESKAVDLLRQVKEARIKCEEVNRLKKETDGICKGIEAELIFLLQESGMKMVKSEHGKAFLRSEDSYKLPASDEAWDLLYTYMRNINAYDEVVSIGSQTLNGFLRKMTIEAKEQGELFETPPGLEPPVTTIKLSFSQA